MTCWIVPTCCGRAPWVNEVMELCQQVSKIFTSGFQIAKSIHVLHNWTSKLQISKCSKLLGWYQFYKSGGHGRGDGGSEKRCQYSHLSFKPVKSIIMHVAHYIQNLHAEGLKNNVLLARFQVSDFLSVANLDRSRWAAARLQR